MIGEGSDDSARTDSEIYSPYRTPSGAAVNGR